MGDPGGIGPEITAKALRGALRRSQFHYLLIGSHEVYQKLARMTGLRLPVKLVRLSDLKHLKSSGIYFLDITADAAKRFQKKSGGRTLTFNIGKVSLGNACMAYAALEAGVAGTLAGQIQGLVTAPIHKTAMRLVRPGFSGHTEYLAEKSKTHAYAMMFVGPRLKVTLVTIHLALKKVPKAITQQAVLEKIQLTHQFLKKRFRIANPQIAVCALNPHGEETGHEENREIVPAVQKARKAGMRVCGPFSADQLFFEAYQGRYDALISMYHDQGLAPFKMIAFRDGVNVTLGLPFVRTSPDHGTAFDIAYRGKADAASMIASLRLAEKLIS